MNQTENNESEQEQPIDLPKSVRETASEIYSQLEATSLGLRMPGISCGLYDLDAVTQGFQKGDLVVLAGATCMGKTTMASNIARNIAAFHNMSVVFFTAEMTEEALTNRLLSAESGIEAHRLRSGRVAANEWTTIGNAINALSKIPIFIKSVPSLEVDTIENLSAAIQKEQDSGLGLIVVDNLHLISTENDEFAEVSRIIRRLKALALRLQVPVLLLSQVNTAVEKRTNKRPLLGDLRLGAVIENVADVVLALYREEWYNPSTPDRGIAEVLILKQRNNAAGYVAKYLFEPQFNRFRNLAASLKK
jgi:replicative DNA helicase